MTISARSLVSIIKFLVGVSLLCSLIVGGGLFPFSFGKIIFLRSIVEILFIAYLLLVFRNKSYLPKPNIVFWAATFFTISYAISSFASVNFYGSIWGSQLRAGGLINLVHFYVLFLITYSTLTRDEIIRLFKMSIIIASIVSVFALFQLPVKPHGFLGNAALLAGYLLFNIFFAFYFIFSKKMSLGWRMFYVGFIFISILLIYFSAVRGTMLALLFGSIYFFTLTAKAIYKKLIYFILVILGVAGLLIIFSPKYLGPIQHINIVERFSDKTTFTTRLMTWNTSLDAWRLKPLVGFGPENFSFVYNKYYNPKSFWSSETENNWDKAHNLFFEILIGQGLIGLLIFIFLVFVLFVRTINQFDRKTSSMVGATMVAYLIHNLFSFDSVPSTHLFFILLAFISSSDEATKVTDESKISKKTQSLHNSSIHSLAYILIVIMGIIFYQLNAKEMLANSYFKKAKSIYSKNPSTSLDLVHKAFYTGVADRNIFAKEFATLVLTKADYVEISGLLPTEKEFQSVISLLETNIKAGDNDVFHYIYLGHLYLKYGILYKKPENVYLAEKVLNEAEKLFAKRQQFLYLHAELQLENNDKVKATATLNEAINLNPESPESYLKMAFAMHRMKNNKEANYFSKKAEALGYNVGNYLPDIFRLISLYVDSGEYLKIISLYGKVTSIKPNHGQAYASLAEIYRQIGDIKLAKEYGLKAGQVDQAFKVDSALFIKNLE